MMLEKDVAICVPGDENIFYTLVVTLASIRKHNKELPLYIYSNCARLSQSQMRLLSKHDIEFIPKNRTISEYIDGFDLSNFHWGSGLFIAYIIPYYFFCKGYKFCINFDHDMFCISNLLKDALIFPDAIFLARKSRWLGDSYTVSPDNLKYISVKYHIDMNMLQSLWIPNGGFLGVNIDKYITINGAHLFRDICNFFVNISPHVARNEIAVAIMSAMRDSPIKWLSSSYNESMLWAPMCDDARMLHFIWPKPWRIAAALAKNEVRNVQGMYYLTTLAAMLPYIDFVREIGLEKEIFPDGIPKTHVILNTLSRMEKELQTRNYISK